MSSHRAPQAQQAPAVQKSRASELAPTPHAEGATGVPLPQAMRRQMEEAFGASFNGVRLDVNRSAEGRGARAFAQGTRITVAPG